MTEQNFTASFTKQDGQWAIRLWDDNADPAILKMDGQQVLVSKRNGDTQTVTLGDHLMTAHRGRSSVYAIKREAAQATATPQVTTLVPDGRYAVLINGEWSLYRVWRGTRNPNIQHVYKVKGTEKGDRVFGAEESQAVALIAKDPGQAAIDFGHCTGRCSRCGKEMDVNLTRFMGIGPDCAKHFMANDARLAAMGEAREILRAVGIDPNEKNDDLAPARDLRNKIEFAKREDEQERAAWDYKMSTWANMAAGAWHVGAR